MFKWNVGNGKKIKFWFDMWYGDRDLKSVFPRFYSLTIWKDISLAGMIENWDVNSKDMWRRRRRGWEIESRHVLGELIEKTKLYNKKYHLICLGCNNQLNSKDLYLQSDRMRNHRGKFYLFWKPKMPEMIKILVWKLVSQILTVRVFLQHRSMDIDTKCTLCSQNEETLDHLFWNCVMVHKMWSLIRWWWNISLQINVSSSNLVFLLSHADILGKHGEVWKMLVVMTWWYIWKVRN